MPTTNQIVDYCVLNLCEGGGSVSVLKLHKILYYLQAWNLAFGRGQLFPSQFQAWVHGPVSRPVFDRFKDTKMMYSLVTMEDITDEFDPNIILSDDQRHIQAVLDVYAPLSGGQLEEMTHNEKPWVSARKDVEPAQRSTNVIDEGVMTEYYKARLQ